MATEVVVPMLGITVEKGKIVEWLKNEGTASKRERASSSLKRTRPHWKLNPLPPAFSPKS